MKRQSKFDGVLKQAAAHRKPEEPPLPSGGREPKGKGKRVNPEYAQTTAYIPKTLYRAVRKHLMDDDRQDYSELVEELLSAWIGRDGNTKPTG